MEQYDAAISFAGEQRHIAKKILRQLTPLGYKIFYDENHIAETWGEYLPALFHEIYSKTKVVIIIVSEEYLRKKWTTFERRAALENYIQNGGKILQLKTDDSDIPILSSIGSLRYDNNINEICSHISVTLGIKKALRIKKSKSSIKLVMQICFRRAIFTSMEEEINSKKMFESISECISQLNKILPSIHDGGLSQFVKSIIRDLNSIDKYSQNNFASYTFAFNKIEKIEIDALKLRIINNLHHLNYVYGAHVDIPDDIGLEYDLKHYDFIDKN